WAYNYILADYDQLSNSVTNIQNAASNQNYQYTNINENHINTSNGEMKIRFTSTSTTIGDDFFVDFVSIGSVAIEAAGLTADAIQQAVWVRSDEGHDDNTLGYNISQNHLEHGTIVSATDASQFVISTGVAVNDMYNNMVIILKDITNGHQETRMILDSIAASDEIILNDPVSFTPVALDIFYIMNTYAGTNTTHVVGTAQTANDNGADINAILADTNELQGNQGDWATATGFATPTNITAGTITTVSGNVDGAVGSVTADVATDSASRTASKADVSGLATTASLDEAKGATFVTGTDSLEAVRNRGDTAWLTGNTTTPDTAGTAAALHATTDALINGLNDITVAEIIAGISDGTYDLQEMVRILFAALGGKSDGGGTTTLHFRDSADAKNRITATVDANGNRTSITLDGS
ncbi:hypothetical protein KAR91_32070, partial [Candidatus Pacearchaeota archaeon]|nr:hypothetical protein [Candidatus Pacearchaeota archaeon]